MPLDMQLNEIRDLLISGIYNMSSSVIITGSPSAVLTSSKTVRFAVAVPPPMPQISVLQPNRKLNDVVSLKIPYNPL